MYSQLLFPHCPRQRLILNLGTLDIDPDDYQILAKRIQELLTGSSTLFDDDAGYKCDETIEKHARAAADRIIAKKSIEEPAQSADTFEQIDPGSFSFSHARSLGPEYVVSEIYKELGIERLLRQNGVKDSTAAMIEALVVGRCVNPASERHTMLWCESSSALFELTGEPEQRSPQSWYRAGDVLWKHKDKLEEHLARKQSALYDLDEKLILYDLTNTHFEGGCAGNPKAKYGRSKQKRSDCRLQTLALVTDGSGFAKFSKLYPGNQHEASTLSAILDDLEKHYPGKEKPTVAMDSGIATDENLSLLKEKEYKYIAVSRSRRDTADAQWDQIESQTVREDESKGIKVEVKRYERDDEVYLRVKSEKKRLKEAAMMSRVEELLTSRLQYYRDGLKKKGRTRRYDKILETIGRLKERYPKAALLYDIKVIPGEADEKRKTVNTADITWQKKDDLLPDRIDSQGCYLLRTNRPDLKDSEIWELYITLNNIEKAFRDMKSHLGLRPNFHQRESRVGTHMFISVIAYHIIHAIEHKLKLSGDHRSWRTIKTMLASHQRISLCYVNRDLRGNFFNNTLRLDSKIEHEQQDIYAKPGLSGRALHRKKTKYQIRYDHAFHI